MKWPSWEVLNRILVVMFGILAVAVIVIMVTDQFGQGELTPQQISEKAQECKNLGLFPHLFVQGKIKPVAVVCGLVE